MSIGDSNGAQAAVEVIDLPQLKDLLAAQGLTDLLVAEANQQWLLKANVVIERSARLNVTAATTSWLKLHSPPAAAVVLTVQRGGHLYLDGVKVTSWSSTAGDVDRTVADGRSYLLALHGARMDLLQSEVAFLGAGSGEPSGLSWRKRLDDNDPTTGATGRVEESKIHDNYFGIYTYEAYGLKILHSEVYDNLYYGIDPHDDSRGFEVAYNKVYGNGTHGIIFSRRCIDNVIHHNEVYDNDQHGIMLDRGTNQNKVYANTVYNNQDGIAVYQSSDNQIYENVLRNNQRGVRINATYDADDPYDGLATNNQIYNNQIEDSAEHGFYLYARADRNLIDDNQILRSGSNGIYIKSGGNRLANNTIVDGNVGITIVGGEYRDDPATALPALDPSGDKNIMVGMTIRNNRDVGIRILGGSHNRVGPEAAGESANVIEENGKDGIAIGDATNGAAATDNAIVQNTIRGNTRHGVLVTDQTSVRNRIS
ncbi:MAG: right-handed parallel beta-helix repeat-containing protein, partial [Caldilineaceae bacterium]|nr:right-handed parallel beta-helix repeat-containing protein [Caldilineaceae bacterium]